MISARLTYDGGHSSHRYEVQWAKWPSTTWEPAANLVGSTEAVKAYLSKKHYKKRKPQ